MPNSIIFVPSHVSDYQRWVDDCARHCNGEDHRVLAVVSGWADAFGYAADGRADLVVAARRDHLPPDRLPRLIVLSELLKSPGPRQPRVFRLPRNQI